MRITLIAAAALATSVLSAGTPAAAGTAGQDASGPLFHVRDLGIRCVRAPCFSLRAARLNKPSQVTLSGVDLRPARLSERDQGRAEAALATASGLFVSGKVVATADGGRTLRVTRVYLRGAMPRG